MASLVGYLERMTALQMMATHTIKTTQSEFIRAEEKLLDCESNISNMTALPSDICIMQSVSKQLWKVSTTGHIALEALVYLDETTGYATRLSWRQVFKE